MEPRPPSAPPPSLRGCGGLLVRMVHSSPRAARQPAAAASVASFSFSCEQERVKRFAVGSRQLFGLFHNTSYMTGARREFNAGQATWAISAAL